MATNVVRVVVLVVIIRFSTPQGFVNTQPSVIKLRIDIDDHVAYPSNTASDFYIKV